MQRIRTNNINTAEHFNDVFDNNINLYNSYKNIRLYNKVLYLDLFRKDSYLDFGCGNGDELEKLKIEFPETRIIGVDISDQIIDRNKREYIKCNFFELTEFWNKPEIVSSIVSTHTFEHIEDPVAEAEKLISLSNGGFLIIVPNEDSWSNCPEHLWRFDKSSFNSLNPSFALKGLTNRAGNTELLFYFDKNRNNSKLNKIILKTSMIFARIFYSSKIGLARNILNRK